MVRRLEEHVASAGPAVTLRRSRARHERPGRPRHVGRPADRGARAAAGGVGPARLGGGGASAARRPAARRMPDGPVVVVPAFLASGFHVRRDVPGSARRAGPRGRDGDRAVRARPGARRRRARPAARRRGGPAERVVLAAAGSTDEVAQADLRTAADLVAARLGVEVPVGYIAGGAPKLARRGGRAGRAGGAADVAARPRGVPPLGGRVGRRRWSRSRWATTRAWSTWCARGTGRRSPSPADLPGGGPLGVCPAAGVGRLPQRRVRGGAGCPRTVS